MKKRTSGWRRHLDGWQAGALVLLIAGSAILLSAPRAVAPEGIPAPAIDRRALGAMMERDSARALAVVEQPLDVDVRAVGNEVRSYNAAAAAAELQELAEARGRVARAVAVALRHDAEPLLRLRAYQMLAFVQAVRTWEKSGEVSDELSALGGDFLDVLRRNRWCREGSRELVMDDATLRVLYKTRWNDITGLRVGPFALSLDEDRLRYGFLLEHPFMREAVAIDRRIDHALYLVRRGEAQLAAVDRLAEADASYPAELARGVVFYRMGRFANAIQHFRRHLEVASDGPYALRAQNYLKAALDRASEGAN